VARQSLNIDFDGTTIDRILHSIGRIEYLGADVGGAALYDLGLLARMYGMFSGALMSTALLLKRFKDDHRSIADVVASSMVPGLTALLPSLTKIAEDTEDRDFGAHGYPNSMQLHVLRAVAQTRTDEGVPAEPLLFLKEMFDEVEREGGGAGGMSLVGRKFWARRV
jgi:hypothetical protein